MSNHETEVPTKPDTKNESAEREESPEQRDRLPSESTLANQSQSNSHSEIKNQTKALQEKDVLPTVSLFDSENNNQSQKPKPESQTSGQGRNSEKAERVQPWDANRTTDSTNPSQNELSPQGKNLIDLARTRIPDAGRPNTTRELAQFESDVAAFEKRARETGMTQEQVNMTLHQVGRLLEKPGQQNEGVQSERHRIRLAEQVMAKAADPTASDQGNYLTCNVTTIENRLYTREPATAAKVVADMALTGQFTATDGSTVKLDKESLRPHFDSQDNNRRGDGSRTFAGQIFQVTASNMLYAQAREQGDIRGGFQYRATAQGERLTFTGDRSKLDPMEREAVDKPGPFHSATLNGMIEINRMLTGKDESQAFLSHSSHREEAADKANFFSTAQELETKLKDLKDKGMLPAIISVRTANDFFTPRQDQNPRAEQAPPPGRNAPEPGEEDGVGGVANDGHVVLVTGIQPGRDGKPTTVTVDDQAGNDRDRGPANPATIDELFSGTKYKPAMESIKGLMTELQEAQKMGMRITPNMRNEALKAMQKEYEQMWEGTEQFLTQEQKEDQATFRQYMQRVLVSNRRRS